MFRDVVPLVWNLIELKTTEGKQKLDWGFLTLLPELQSSGELLTLYVWDVTITSVMVPIFWAKGRWQITHNRR